MNQQAKKNKIEKKTFQYKCLVCSMKTRSFRNFKIHLENHNSPQRLKSCLRVQSSSLMAPECSKKELSSVGGGEGEIKIYFCFFCSSRPFSSRSELETHFRDFHQIQTQATINRIISTCHGQS
jgi:hypothetical protein